MQSKRIEMIADKAWETILLILQFLYKKIEV